MNVHKNDLPKDVKNGSILNQLINNEVSLNASKYFALGLSMERVLVENLILFHKGEAKGQK